MGNPDDRARDFSEDETTTLSLEALGIGAGAAHESGRASRATWEVQETRSVSLPAQDSIWYAWVDDHQEGPMATASLDQALHSGQIDAETLVWRDGLADWTRAGDLLELELLLSGAAQARAPRLALKAPADTQSPLGPRPTVWRPAGSGLDVEALFSDLDSLPSEPTSDVNQPWASAEAMVAEAQILDEVPTASFGEVDLGVKAPDTRPLSVWREPQRAWYARWPMWFAGAAALLLARVAWGVFRA